MEEIKINTGTYTFYKPQNLRGRPNNSIRDFLTKIKSIEKNYPELFYSVLNTQGVCKDIDELNVMYKLLTKKVRVNKTKAKYIYCRFSENEISFFKTELEKQVKNKQWKKESSFNSFISKIINTIIEEIEKEKNVDFRTFENEKPSDKDKYDYIPLTVYESPNIEKPSLKKKLGASIPININQSNFEWVELVCKSISITKSNLIRNCLFSYRIKMEILELYKQEEQIVNNQNNSSIKVSEESKIQNSSLQEEKNHQEEILDVEILFNNSSKKDVKESKKELDVVTDRIGWLVKSINKNILIKYDELERAIDSKIKWSEIELKIRIKEVEENQYNLSLKNHLDLLDKFNHLERIIAEKESEILIIKNTIKYNDLIVLFLIFLYFFFVFF